MIAIVRLRSSIHNVFIKKEIGDTRSPISFLWKQGDSELERALRSVAYVQSAARYWHIASNMRSSSHTVFRQNKKTVQAPSSYFGGNRETRTLDLTDVNRAL